MQFKTLLVAAPIALFAAAPASAVTIDLNLSLGDNSIIFSGLDDEVTDPQTATSYSFLGDIDTYSDISASQANTNFFLFDGVGDVVDLGFQDNTFPTGDDQVGRLSGIFCSAALCNVGEVNLLNGDFVRSAGAYTVVDRPATITPVPLPAGAAFLLAGLLGLAGVKGRRKRAA